LSSKEKQNGKKKQIWSRPTGGRRREGEEGGGERYRGEEGMEAERGMERGKGVGGREEGREAGKGNNKIHSFNH